MYNDKEDIQRRITEIIAITITPLEWKANDQKKAERAANKAAKKAKKRSWKEIDNLPATIKPIIAAKTPAIN